jgi:hypothetical protein
MVRNFRLPPPLFPLPPHAKAVKIDLDDETDRKGLSRMVREAGVIQILNDVNRRFMPYVEKKIARVPPDAIGWKDEAGNYHSPEDAARLMAQGIALFYVGRRLGTFMLAFCDSSEDGEPPTDLKGHTGALLSELLNKLSEILGQKSTGQLFRKLDAITNDVLEQHHGKAR